MCSRPVSTANLDPEMELFCKECDQELLELDCGYRSWEQADNATKRGLERAERNEEEEWGRIPIPQSDDSNSTDVWLSEEPEQHESTSTDDQDQSQKGYLNCFVAFLIAPRKDGRVLTKEGKIIDVNDGSTSNEQQQARGTCRNTTCHPTSPDEAPHRFPTSTAGERIQKTQQTKSHDEVDPTSTKISSNRKQT
jgi:hypothetical protein